MADKPETKLVYNDDDLASLVVGDRVRLECRGEENIHLAVLKNKSSESYSFVFLYSAFEPSDMVSRVEAAADEISFDDFGNIVLGTTKSFEDYSAANEKGKLARDLPLLKQAGLYKE